MPVIAALIARALRGRDDAAELEVVRKDVAALCARFPALPERTIRRRLTGPCPTAQVPPCVP